MFVRFIRGWTLLLADYFAGEVPERLVTMSAVRAFAAVAGDANQAVKQVSDLATAEPVLPSASCGEEELEWHLWQ
ncbi:MAG: hypothetical protein U0894_08115 [Pirellulales bacterium]